jgi:hypothetical protein
MTVLGDQELLAIVRRAYTTLSDSSRWSARHYAEDSTGRWAPVGSEQARRFNLEGALMHAAGSDARSALAPILEIFQAIDPAAPARRRATSTNLLTRSEALALLEAAMAHLSFRPVRKQSGTHLRAVMPEDEVPLRKKTARD